MLKRFEKVSSSTHLLKVMIHSKNISADTEGRKLWSLPSERTQYNQGVRRHEPDDPCSRQGLVTLVDFRVPRLYTD